MWRLRLRRLARARRVAGSALQNCWQAPLPSTSSDWREVSFLAVDGEMSSLNPASGELLSIGWVAVERGGIVLGSARYHLLRPRGGVGQSATIHSLRDCEFADAGEPRAVLEAMLADAAGKVLVFHNAVLDLAFLDRLSKEFFGARLLLPVADTLLLEERLLRRREQPIRPGDLRLQGCRDRYHLPRMPAHNALVDAVATAELLLAHAAHRGDVTLAGLLAPL